MCSGRPEGVDAGLRFFARVDLYPTVELTEVGTVVRLSRFALAATKEAAAAELMAEIFAGGCPADVGLVFAAVTAAFAVGVAPASAGCLVATDSRATVGGIRVIRFAVRARGTDRILANLAVSAGFDLHPAVDRALRLAIEGLAGFALGLVECAAATGIKAQRFAGHFAALFNLVGAAVVILLTLRVAIAATGCLLAAVALTAVQVGTVIGHTLRIRRPERVVTFLAL